MRPYGELSKDQESSLPHQFCSDCIIATRGYDFREGQQSVDTGIATILAAHGRIDVVVHNAGHMVFGPAEAFTPEQLAELYDVNVLSTQRVNRAALPHLRKQGQGLLVWVSSSSSAGGTPPYLAPYFTAKAGMDAMAVQYARELSRWGIEKLRSSFLVPSPAAPTTSPTRADLPMARGSPSTRSAHTPASASRYKKPSPGSCRQTPMPPPSPMPSSRSSTLRSASDPSAFISTLARTVPTWPSRSSTVSAPRCCTAWVFPTCSHQRSKSNSQLKLARLRRQPWMKQDS